MNTFKQISSLSIGLLCAGSAFTAHATELTAGFNIGVLGTGAYVSGDTGWSMNDQDKIRWRASFSGLDTDVKNERFSDNKYSGDIKSSGVQVGLDWYPFSNQFFVSGGAASFDREYDLKITPQKDFTIGNQRVLVSDNVSLKTKLDHSTIAPYLSVGWGNRHSVDSGFAIFGEVGVMFPSDDADVSFTLNDVNGVVSADNLALEKRDFEDDINKTQLLATIGIGYHF